jgi:hypothetical protein
MPYSLVQQNTNRAGAVTSHDITLNGVTAGNLLVLFVGTFDETGTGGSVSGGGATWTRRATDGATDFVRTHIYEGVGTTGGDITVTYTPADAADVAVILAEFANPAVSPFDVEAGTTGTGTTPDSGATATLAQADALKVSACVHSGGNVTMVPRAGDGDTQVTGQENGSTGMVIGGSYQILSTTTAVRGRWTLGASQNWAPVSRCSKHRLAADRRGTFWGLIDRYRQKFLFVIHIIQA